MISRMFLGLGLAACLSGCAYVTSVPVTADNADARGLVHYEVMPVLVVSGGQANIEYLPDRNKKRVLQFGAFLAKNDMKITLREDGTLATVNSNMDATASVGGLFEIANKIVEAALPSAPAAAGSVDGAGDVRIFAFVFDDDGALVGLRELKHIALGKVVSQTNTAPLPVQPGPDVTSSTNQS
ncbi:hypothetical protein VK792_17830 [Mesobacterium sp. TK19101]|uniref:Lipoprotein n=1 Tax=Mesobacterium hydrothermale TaxID=3111907 RepID=A0ABU6HM19_9RHOB|nr:hypothetical protein [Mesobacterium sp. TK19101]MEC3863157.1 hypothetical protein [Mesobacterium sp. TK19101]